VSLYERMRRHTERAASAVRLAFRAVLSGLATGTRVQLGQLAGLSGETLQRHELFQQYGFTSAPPDGTQCIVLPLGGKTSHGVIVATEHGSFRIKGLARGEAAIYNSRGDFVHLKADGTMEVSCATLSVSASDQVILDSPQITCTGRVDFREGFDVSGQGGAAQAATVRGDIRVVEGDVTAEGVSLRNHVHGGVARGPDRTGTPET
jgi:phage baseplate assembly protein V